MAGFTTSNTQNLLRTNIWSRQIKELLLDELNAMKFVRIISDFPDGVTLNIPSIGEAETGDFTEGQAIKYNTMDTTVKTGVPDLFGKQNFAICWKPLKLTLHFVTMCSGKNDSNRGQSAGKASNARERSCVDCGDLGRRRFNSSLLKAA